MATYKYEDRMMSKVSSGRVLWRHDILPGRMSGWILIARVMLQDERDARAADKHYLLFASELWHRYRKSNNDRFEITSDEIAAWLAMRVEVGS